MKREADFTVLTIRVKESGEYATGWRTQGVVSPHNEGIVIPPTFLKS